MATKTQLHWGKMNQLQKKIINGRMLKNTGSWLYCDQCNKTVGYLCYSTYQSFRFNFSCKCGNSGLFDLEYPTRKKRNDSEESLKTRKNRLVCPNDESPLFSIVEKHLERYSYSVICNRCNTVFGKDSNTGKRETNRDSV